MENPKIKHNSQDLLDVDNGKFHHFNNQTPAIATTIK